MDPVNPLEGVTTNWGFGGSDIWATVMVVVASLSVFVVLGLAVRFVPRVLSLIGSALFGGRNRSN